jgi:nicotinate-nucleotide adenylyltransferase
METIALFGGSFDPPHIGHRAIVEALNDLKFIDKTVVMPTYLNPFKSKSYASSELRFKWLQEMFYDLKNVEISDYEIRQKRKVTTLQSVHFLLKKYKKIYLVIGADNIASLPKWSGYNELKDLVTFIVAKRDGIEIDKRFLTLNIDKRISSTTLRENVESSMLPQECAKEIEKYYKNIK